MKLELGKCYIDRSGNIRGPLIASTAESARQGFTLRHGWRSYRPDGAFRIRGHRWGKSSPLDLIAEVRHKDMAGLAELSARAVARKTDQTDLT